MNSENSETSEAHILVLSITNKLDWRRDEKIIALSNLSIYYAQKDIKISYNYSKFKILAPAWNDKFESPDGSYSVLNIQYYFEYIFKKYRENINKLPVIRN